MSSISNIDVTVKYEFPQRFQPTILRGYAKIIEKALLDFDLARKLLAIDTQDIETDVQRALTTLVTTIRQFKHEQAAIIDSPLPYVTKSATEVADLRRELHESVYRLFGIFDDTDVSIKLQLFRLTQFSAYTTDANVKHMSAADTEVAGPERQRAQLSLQNLQQIAYFFDSVEESEVFKDLASGVEELELIKPTVSFGALKFEEDNANFNRLSPLQF